MTEMRTLTIALPETVADDLEYYSDESGLYTDANEMLAEAVRSLLMDVMAGYNEEINSMDREYTSIRENGLGARRVELTVTESMARDIETIVLPMGIDMNRFVGVAAVQRINDVAMYGEDRDERLEGTNE